MNRAANTAMAAATTSETPGTPVLLIPGHWLGAWAWDEVSSHLSTAGLRPIPLTLPGLDPADPDRAARTLDEQIAAIEDALAAAVADAGTNSGEAAVVVAHSGANAPVSSVLDRRPELVRHVVWVDSGPVARDGAFAPDIPAELTELPLPPFAELGQQASLEGLGPEELARFRARAVPEPGPVLRGVASPAGDAGRDIPSTIVCCSISSAQMTELADSGHPMFSEVSRLSDRELVDLPTGHWPMWSRPSELARIIASAAGAER